MFTKVSSSILLIFLSSVDFGSCVTDYCGTGICKTSNYANHITCGASGDLSPSCPSGARAVPLTNENIRQIVDLHNQYRNKLAGGNEPRFNPAAKMTTMKWNQELADYAGLNVRRCREEHDCHNTQQMMYSGQNLNTITTYGGGSTFKDIPTLIEESIRVWYNENQYASMNQINNCCGVTEGPKQIGHFLEMVVEKNNQVGCAVSEFTNSVGKVSYIACNYGYTIITGRTVYESGTPGSECATGTNQNYPALCSTNEQVDLDKVF